MIAPGAVDAELSADVVEMETLGPSDVAQNVGDDQHRGPEPDLIKSEELDEPSLTPTNNEVVTEEDQSSWMVAPDWFKCGISFAIWCVIFITFIVIFIAIANGGLFCEDTPNDATKARLGSMLSFQNTSSEICIDFYDYSCGSYNSRYADSSLFSETQFEIVNKLVKYHSFNVDTTLTNGTEYQSLGLYNCVDIEVQADFNKRDTDALYIGPVCPECPPQIHHLYPVVIPSTVPEFDSALNSLISTTISSGLKVYWIPPEDGSSPTEWMNQCNLTKTSASAQWISLASRSDIWTMMTFYSNEMIACCGSVLTDNDADVLKLIEDVRKYAIEYITTMPKWVTETTQPLLLSRLKSLRIVYGIPSVTADPVSSCTFSMSLQVCLSHLHSIQRSMLQTRRVHNNSEREIWPFSPFTVNAAYSPLDDKLYIPSAISQAPFYSSEWTDMIKMATLGSIIAHEIGHSIDATPFTSIPMSAEYSTEKMCIALGYQTEGSLRPNRTQSENWADFFGMQVILRYIRTLQVKDQKDAFILWTQTWCSAGTPKYMPFDSTDPHSSPFLRANSTLSITIPFYSTFKCPMDSTMCG